MSEATNRHVGPDAASEARSAVPLLIEMSLSVHFLPTFRIREEPIILDSIECLVRGPSGSTFEMPDRLFSWFASHGRVQDLDEACFATSARAATKLPGEPRISINVSASTLSSAAGTAALLRLVRSAERLKGRLVIDVETRRDEAAPGPFREGLERLKEAGVSIALDEREAFSSPYPLLSAGLADVVKLSSEAVKQLRRDAGARDILRAYRLLADRLGFRIAAEGVRSYDDLERLLAEGVDLVQGSYICPPMTHDSIVRTRLLSRP